MTKTEVMIYEAREQAARYAKANTFLTLLKSHRREMSDKEFKALRTQALSGDIQGAESGLRRIVMGRW